MMKKSYFMKTFDFTMVLLGFCIGTSFLNFFLKYVAKILSTKSFFNVSNILSFIQTLQYWIEKTNKVFIILCVLIILIELYQRLLEDTLWNYFKSIFQTIRFRNYLRQVEQTTKIVTLDNKPLTAINLITRASIRL